jgi:acetoin utilization deacetylase AcuC-like enzyme
MAMKVGIVRDERCLGHKTGLIHPENPNRLKAIYAMLDRDFSSGLAEIEAEPATLEQLELVHSPGYINKVLRTADHSMTSLAPDTPASAKTYLAAWVAAGACIKALEALLSGRCDVCFALIRPPGHHAMKNRAAGFCIFNNLGIAARYAGQRYGLKRILIVDYDVHHGNGLNNLFYERKSVVYLSSHDPGLYPYSGDWGQTGEGRGEGYTINLPLPRGLKDKEFLYIYREVAARVIRRFEPELILVAAGFDAHRDDPIGRWKLSEQCFGWLTRLLLDARAEVNHPPVLLTLEGGYAVSALADSVGEVLNALTGKGYAGPVPAEQSPRAAELVEKARRIHKKYGVWVE